MTTKQTVLERLAELVEQVKNGEVIGLTIVTTSSSGKVDMQTLFYPEKTSA